jgi:NDP-sugar pyrophosphorylase family protein
MEGAVIKDIERLEDSLIGKNAKITKNRKSRVIKLHVGDYSEVEI